MTKYRLDKILRKKLFQPGKVFKKSYIIIGRCSQKLNKILLIMAFKNIYIWSGITRMDIPI